MMNGTPSPVTTAPENEATVPKNLVFFFLFSSSSCSI
jgi:hypothetical protein